MPKVRSVSPVVFALLITVGWATALADPPSHAPAHGWRMKHDPYYVGYSGKHWDRDFGILSGRCNREAVATVLGGAVGGLIGSRIGDDENRTVAIIIGAATGALIGKKIGRELDKADRGCFGHTLEVGKPGQRVTWVNEEARVRYEMSPGATNDEYGDSCRDYTLRAFHDDGVTSRRGVACQAEPGAWRILSTTEI